MFTVWCPGHGSTVLIWTSDIDRIVNTSDGIAVHYHCGCGRRGVWLTGRRAPGSVHAPHRQPGDTSRPLAS
ncbi:MAG: hypothetical protein ACRDRY_23680 [Pseudonocardiaceae bacterium]